MSGRESCRRVAGEEAVCDVGEAGGSVIGEAGGRLCPRETHGRPWPCEWVARRHCVKRRGERQYVAKTRSERSGKRRDGAKRKVSEGSCLRLAMMAVVPAPLWHFPVFRTCNVRKKIGLSRTFSSGRVTLGNPQPAYQAPLWHILVFRTCNVRKKIGLPRTFSSGHVTSGTA